MKNWVVAVGVVVGLGAVMFFSDRAPKTPNGVDLIRSDAQYLDVYNRTATIAVPIFQKVDGGTPMNAEDEAKIRESARNFESVNIYRPQTVMGQYYLGRCWQLLGEKVKAAQCFDQAIVDFPFDPQRQNKIVELTSYDAMGLLSEICLDLSVEELANANSASQAGDAKGAQAAKDRSKIYVEKAFQNADSAVKNVPNGYRYLIDRGMVLLTMGKRDEAKQDILKAKQLAPSDPRVKMALMQIGL